MKEIEQKSRKQRELLILAETFCVSQFYTGFIIIVGSYIMNTMKQLLPTVFLGLGILCIIGCDKKETQTTQTNQDSSNSSSSKQYSQYTASDIVEMNEVDLLLAIKKSGFDDKGVLVFTEKLKEPETNKILGNTFKQDYTFDWYSTQMLALKMAEQQFRALDMIKDADKVNKAVESLEIAWLEGNLHEILYASFYNLDIDAILNNITEKMSEEEKQQLSVDTRPVKALAERLLKQTQSNSGN
jgi:hypothetical protein